MKPARLGIVQHQTVPPPKVWKTSGLSGSGLASSPPAAAVWDAGSSRIAPASARRAPASAGGSVCHRESCTWIDVSISLTTQIHIRLGGRHPHCPPRWVRESTGEPAPRSGRPDIGAPRSKSLILGHVVARSASPHGVVVRGVGNRLSRVAHVVIDPTSRRAPKPELLALSESRACARVSLNRWPLGENPCQRIGAGPKADPHASGSCPSFR